MDDKNNLVFIDGVSCTTYTSQCGFNRDKTVID